MRKLVSFFPSRCLAGALEFRMNIVYIIICDKHHEVAEIPPGRELSNLLSILSILQQLHIAVEEVK